MTDEVLASWNDGPAKQAILAFVEAVTTAGSAFVAPADRIATFDIDGTLWVERPAPPQFDFMLGTWANEVDADPSLASTQPYKAIVEQDPEFFEEIATQDPVVLATLEEAMARSWKGATPDEFDARVRAWAAAAKQPSLKVGYTDLVYRPMLELFDLLRANEFRLFVCSGLGREFIRVVAEELWGIYKEDVIGSAAGYQYTDGRLLRIGKLVGGLALGPGKPEHIFAQIGRLPVFAGGNADVDIEMLESASFALLVNHDDADRELAYTKGAERSLTEARERGWTVVSMKHDWKTVFVKEIAP